MIKYFVFFIELCDVFHVFIMPEFYVGRVGFLDFWKLKSIANNRYDIGVEVRE